MRVALFVTCLIDLFRPQAASAAVSLLRRAGCEVEIPLAQTCCGQPAFNNGNLKAAIAVARQVLQLFSRYDYVVIPSGSCAGMLHHYPELFDEDSKWNDLARDLVARTFEITVFLSDVLKLEQFSVQYPKTVTYHDSCSSLRQLGIKEQPRRLLKGVTGLTLVEMRDTDVCCGFGGTFCVKFPEVSQNMVDNKINNILETGADTLLAGDLGCLLNISGRLHRLGQKIQAYHITEVLAGDATGPGIGDEDPPA